MKTTTKALVIAGSLMFLGNLALAQSDSDARAKHDWWRVWPPARGTPIRIRTDQEGEFSIRDGGLLQDETELIRSGDSLRVTDSQGRVLLELECTEDGRIIMPPEATLSVSPQPVKRAVIGIKMVSLGEALAFQLDLEPASGALVSEVTEGYPAERAGLERHDVIIRADGQALNDALTLRSVLAGKQDGEEVVLTVIRGGRRLDVSIPVREEEVHDAYFNRSRLSDSFDTANLFYDRALLGQDRGQGRGQGGAFGFPQGLERSGYNVLRDSFLRAREPQEPQEQRDDTPQLADLDRRLERLERLLEKLVDEK